MKTAQHNATVMNIPMDLIDVPPQVRTKFNQQSIEELAADIKATGGLISPCIVQQNGPRFLLRIGGRRYRALMLNGATTLPAIVGTIADSQVVRMQLIENIQREDLSTKDLANAVKDLWEQHGRSAAEVARQLHKSPSWVSKRLALALGVGESTAALLDGQVKDVELLYNFTKLEKTDPATAREMVPGILCGDLGREDVVSALLANPDTLPATAPIEHNPTLPLFPETQQSDRPADAIEAAPVANAQISEQLRQQYALMYQALKDIRDMDKSLRPQQKAEAMREIARHALDSFK